MIKIKLFNGISLSQSPYGLMDKLKFLEVFF
ncbi:hypothetical protein N206_07450 [Helicobacter pylori UM111]|nr:hypothetical protein N206_07450 [Helicobacter pylori UM111]